MISVQFYIGKHNLKNNQLLQTCKPYSFKLTYIYCYTPYPAILLSKIKKLKFNVNIGKIFFIVFKTASILSIYNNRDEYLFFYRLSESCLCNQ